VDASSLSPVWNPPEDQLLATNNQVVSKQPDRPQHPLLDERLVGAQVKAVVNDGENYKNREVFVSIARVEGVLSIRHRVYNTSKGLVPAWVSLKSPNPTLVFSWFLKVNIAVNMLDEFTTDTTTTMATSRH
jgi:hypothetical protein